MQAKRLGAYWMTSIRGRKVLCFKSESRLSQDGPKMPNFDVWRQIIDEVQPKLVITTGTGGGIGKQWEVGDVIVSPLVRFDCIRKLKTQPFAMAPFRGREPIRQKNFRKAVDLFKTNATHLPNTNVRKRVSDGENVHRDDRLLRFDNAQNTFKLQGLGNLSEMGDAVLGDVAKQLGDQRAGVGRGAERLRSADQRTGEVHS